ncbi:MFS transporter [Bacillus cereus]|nr:MFS transporter [Bacillus cereus]
MKRKKSNLGIVIAGLLLGILMGSMDGTIVATAMGTIVGELGGLDKFVWVTSAYMVAELAGVPIFGKLSDMYGRKRFFVFGLLVFIIGSALCGTADSITELAIYRAIQGIGAGAIIPIAFTIMLDVVPFESRGKFGGIFGSIFGLSSIFGPLLGAYITDYINWKWIFYINLPVGVTAVLMIVFFYKESYEHSKQPIDWAGAFTLIGAVICLIFMMELGGKQFAWDSAAILGLFAGFILLTIAFLIIEAKVKEPIISYSLFKNRLYTTSILISLFSGAAFIVASVYMPIFIQGVFWGKATDSGLVLLPMMLASIVTAMIGGFVINKVSYRTVMISTLLVLVAGVVLASILKSDSTRWLITLSMILIGSGIGSSFSVLGMTIGITTFGIIQSQLFSNKLTNYLQSMGGKDAQLPKGLDLKDPHILFSPEAREHIPHEILDQMKNMLSDSITHTFAWAIIPASLAFFISFFMGRSKLDASANADEEYVSGH